MPTKGENFYHSGSKLRRVRLLRNGKPTRNSSGVIIKDAEFCSKKPDAPVMRVEPDRRWFGNTRTITHASFEKLRSDFTNHISDPYSVLLRNKHNPIGLLSDEFGKNSSNSRLLEIEPFDQCFGANHQRRRPKTSFSSIEDLASLIDQSEEFVQKESSCDFELTSDPIFLKGQSKRIWNELFKVIDSSDVVVHVLDSRDPIGTRCTYVESYIKENAPHKHLIFILNKADLVPPKILRSWIKLFSKERPTLAFHASIKNSYGRGALISLLRQFSRIHQDKKQISVGFIGYPNVGKSSVINTLRQKDVCQVAPIPGQTKVWQYVSLMKRIYLIDCPGIVPAGLGEGSDSEKILRGVVRIEHVEAPEDYIVSILRVISPQSITKTFGISAPELEDKDINDAVTEKESELALAFLKQMAIKHGKIRKGGEPDIRTISIMIINDIIRGKVPYYISPSKPTLLQSSDSVETSAESIQQ